MNITAIPPLKPVSGLPALPKKSDVRIASIAFKVWEPTGDLKSTFRPLRPLKQVTTGLSSWYKDLHAAKESPLMLLEHQRAYEAKKEPVSRWVMVERIGSGAYGKVYKGKDEQTGKAIAIKKFYDEEPDCITDAQKEKKALLRWRHIPHVIHFYGYVAPKQLVLERGGKTLGEVILASDRIFL